jgi:Fe-S-cluster containining protein
MIIADLFHEYEQLVAKAEHSFQETEKNHSDCIKCDIHCSDCCHAIFGVFIIEAAYINYHFKKMDAKIRQEINVMAEKFDLELQSKAQTGEPIEKLRVRCPLLNDKQECQMYKHRPITCRVYGVPTMIDGKVHVCYKSGFKNNQVYPVFNLDVMYKELFELSVRYLEALQYDKDENAALLLSVSTVLQKPIEEILKEI